ncbi:MAG: hypothetical protein JNJ54_16225 [Myxococcaceae bacterium]|nr:hypothetical protein [Myxococcaceae bacterium]
MSVSDALLTPVDVLRAGVLRVLAPWLSPLYADRRRRVWWLGVFSVVSAFVVTGLVPLWSLALGPVLLGVPHLVSDVRYLVVRPGLHLRHALLVLAGGPLLATSFGAGPVVGLASVVPAVLVATPRSWKLVLALGGWAALTAAAWLDPWAFQLGFLHAHNLVAVLVWWLLSPRAASMAWIPALTLVGVAAIFAGALDPLLTVAGGWSAPWTGASFTEFVETITPALEPTLAARLVLSFCFLQSVHYAVWLRLVPDDERPRPAPRTFRSTWAALEHDFGRGPLLAFVALALGIAGWGLVNLPGARLGYLHLAAFHGYLELAVLARWFVHGRRT